MIRSKDLVLFVLVLFFLGIAIFATLTKDSFYRASNSIVDLSSANADVPISGAFATEKIQDRQSEIERLRAKLAEGQVIESVPSVEAPEVSTTSDQQLDMPACSTPDAGIVLAKQWPLKDVSVEIVEGVRLVTLLNTVETPQTQQAETGTSTLSPPTLVVTKKALLRLPLSPVKASQPVCPTSEIVGVTSEGSLMFNGDAVLYRSRGSEELLGYALDGFPIYGAYNGLVDACGGYESPAGYRYTVKTDKNSILSCFQAAEESFLIP